MRIVIQTTVDQDAGLEALQAQSGDVRPINVFAESFLVNTLNSILPRLASRRREMLKRLVDSAPDEALDAIDAAIPKTP